MKFKKFSKMFVLFSLMNLVGTVVWAAENGPEKTKCAMSTDQQKPSDEKVVNVDPDGKTVSTGQ